MKPLKVVIIRPIRGGQVEIAGQGLTPGELHEVLVAALHALDGALATTN
jgi:hypothetical protein